MGRSFIETMVGALVLVVAIGFTAYAFTQSGGGRPAGYEVVGRFDRVDGIKRGSDVTLAGVKVGTVSSVELDGKHFKAIVRMSIDNAIKIPKDSAARVMSESLLGGSLILIDPCCDETALKPGEEFVKTEGAKSLIELLVIGATGGVQAAPKQ